MERTRDVLPGLESTKKPELRGRVRFRFWSRKSSRSETSRTSEKSFLGFGSPRGARNQYRETLVRPVRCVCRTLVLEGVWYQMGGPGGSRSDLLELLVQVPVGLLRQTAVKAFLTLSDGRSLLLEIHALSLSLSLSDTLPHPLPSFLPFPPWLLLFLLFTP